MFGAKSSRSKRIALFATSSGAYLIATYMTYEFLTAGKDVNEELKNVTSSNKITSDNGSQEAGKPQKPILRSYVTDPNRTQTFSKIADVYDDQISRDELVMGINLLRRALLYFHASGSVLEVGAGTARNLDYYPSSSVSKIILTDSSEKMLLKGRSKLRAKKNMKIPTSMFVADASDLSVYGDDTFDTVVDSFGICSFDDPKAVLSELKRVCKKKNGKILLLEHGRSQTWEGLNGYLDRNAERHAKNWGCVWNRDIESIVRNSGLDIQVCRTWHFGTTYYLVCTPKREGDTIDNKSMVTDDETFNHKNLQIFKSVEKINSQRDHHRTWTSLPFALSFNSLSDFLFVPTWWFLEKKHNSCCHCNKCNNNFLKQD